MNSTGWQMWVAVVITCVMAVGVGWFYVTVRWRKGKEYKERRRQKQQDDNDQ